MLTLREQLQSSLGEAYIVERELGGGGMSRVFVARDMILQREVVVKVLPPELLAGLSVDRFRREILLAAGLQHPHVVPVISSGEMDGLPWFTMPFIDGESLRAVVTRGPLPVPAVIDIVREVAKALAYAHEHGIVHRDIKPDNVLLTGGTALVTDFGIAKALAASKIDHAGATLTQVGMSIGTPAYMAPEQAAGDTNVDHRADLYSLGCVAYELLAGESPFSGRSTQRTIVAHMVEMPRDISTLRSDTPRVLAGVVMHLLAKNPNDRPQSAAEVLRDLAGVERGAALTRPPIIARPLIAYACAILLVAAATRLAVKVIGLPDWVFPAALAIMALALPMILFTAYAHAVARRVALAAPMRTPGGINMIAAQQGPLTRIAVAASPHLSSRRTALGGTYAIAGFAVLVGAFMGLRAFGIGPVGSLLASGKLGSEPLIVTDFVTVRTDTTLGAVISQAVRANLGQSSAFRLLPQTSVTAALQRMRRPPDSRVDLALAHEIATREGLKGIVDGEIAAIGSGFLVTLRLVTTDSGRVLASFHEPAEGVKELIEVVDKLSRQLRSRIGESLRDVRSGPPLSQATTGSIDALRKFTQAYHATGAGNLRQAIAFDREAVAIDSNFALAWRHLAGAMANARYPQSSIDSALTHAYRLRDRLPERERLVVIAGYFAQAGHDRDKALRAYAELLALGDFSNTNPMGIWLMTRREYARADSVARLRIRAEPGYALTYNNLILWQLAAGRLASAESTYALAASLFPAWPQSGAGALRRASILYAKDDLDGAVAGLDSAQSRHKGLERAGDLSLLAEYDLLRGRVHLSEQHLKEAAILRDPAGGSLALRDTVRAIVSEVMFLGPSPRQVKRLDAVVGGTAFSAAPPNSREYLLSARAYALVGAPARARQLLALYDAEVRDTAFKREAAPKMHGVLAEIALAEHHTLDALAELRKEDVAPDGPASPCEYCLPAMVARAYLGANSADSSIRAIERYLAIPRGGRVASIANGLSSTFLSGDYVLLAPFEMRLGELYATKGDAAKAREHFRRFVDLWKNADPALQSKVNAVQSRITAALAEAARERYSQRP